MTGTSSPVTLRFDAGTLVLEGLGSTDTAPPGASWDERVRRYRAPAWRYRELVTHLTRAARAGGRPFEDDARRYQTLTLAHRAVREAFEHQREALARWVSAGRRGVVVLPTGSTWRGRTSIN
jgi:hypothetical protein